MRSLLSILLIGVPVTLILCLVGLSYGMIEDTQNRTRRIGADIVLRPKNSSYLSLSGAPLPQQMVAFMAKQPNIGMATGVVNAAAEGVTLGAAGINFAEFNAMSGGFTFISGGPFKRPDDVIIDDFYANQKKLSLGDTIKILNVKWHICGIIRSGMLAHIVMPIDTLQDKTGNPGKVSQVYMKVVPGANVNDPSSPLLGRFPTWRISPSAPSRNSPHLLNAHQQRPRLAALHLRHHGDRRGHRVRGGLPLDVHGGAPAHSRNRHPQKPRRFFKSFILRVILRRGPACSPSAESILGILMSDYGACWLIKTLVPASLQMVIVYPWWPIASGITLQPARCWGRCIPD